MSETRVTIDPDGDTLVILAIKQDPPPPSSTEPDDADNSTCPAGTPESPEFIEKHFICSKKHLTLASRRASKLFSSAFKEASKQDDGLYHWNFGDVFDAEAFELALKIIHGRTRGVPQAPELHILAKIASIVDDLECHDAISFFSERWLTTYDLFCTLPQRIDETLAQFILISFVFSNRKLFYNSTEKAIRFSSEGMPTFDLPIRADIPSRIEESRTAVLQYLVDGLYNLQNDIFEGKRGCSDGCRAMLLGSLLQTMRGVSLYPRPDSPFYSLRLDSVINSLRNIQSPTYFSSVAESPAGNHSGSWLLHVRSPSPAAPRSNAATTHSTSSLFGSSPGGMFGSSNTAQNTAASGTASNGLFSGSTVPSAACSGGSVTTTAPQTNTTTQPTFSFGKRTVPQSHNISGSVSSLPEGSMFGNSASARASSTPRTSGPSTSTATKIAETPQMLVRHSCCLKDLIDPILLGAESKIQGLELADFPQP